MRQQQMRGFVGGVMMFLLVLGLSTASFAQGHGRGGGVGGGRGSGGGMGGVGQGNPNGGRPDGVGVDRGLERSSSASNGRADVGRGTAADKSKRRSEEGLNRAR